jgi:protein-S-isoprenylcysteine O-methyltransferase Ste14
MKKSAILIYGILTYAIFHAVFIYAVGFIGNIYVSNSLDAMPSIPFSQALMINLGLLSLFAIQHSGMARHGFKNWVTRYIPASAERSTYVLLSNVVMILLFFFWQPMGGVIWSTDNEVLKNSVMVLYMFGWAVLLVSTFLIDHFHLFGLKQVWYQFKGKTMEPAQFRMPSFYKRVRHPIYVGWTIIVWATPVMTVAHMVFALMCTAYILVGIHLEEKDLEAEFGEAYRSYKEQVPMLIPAVKAKQLNNEKLTSIKQGASS